MKLHENRCRQCKKLFCCPNCRLAHEHKKHSQREIKCPLCCSKKLQLKGDESHEFICHLVFNHLPLLCRLCGQSFESNQDLVILQKCGWWRTENSQRLLQFLGNTFMPTPPSLIINTTLNSCNNKETVSENKQGNDFVTFNSPPVLIRNTSTPMNDGISGLKANLEIRSLNSLSFLLKTPGNFSPSLEEKGSWPTFDNNELRRCSSDTQYYSALYSQSRSSLQGSSFPQKSINSSTNTTAYYSCDQLESDSCRRSGLVTRVKELPETEEQNKKETKESTKRVRFSDQFQYISGMSETSEFLEAREHFSDISQKFQDNGKELEPSVNLPETSSDDSAHHENQLNVEKENNVSLLENKVYQKKNKICLKDDQVCLKENKVCSKEDKVCSEENKVCSKDNKVYLKENKICPRNHLVETKICSQENENSGKEDKENNLPSEQPASSNPGPSGQIHTEVQQSGSSRILMMVLVENGSSLSSSELVPLIDSELKKWEKTTASMNSVYSSISSRSSQEDRNTAREPGARRRSITSVNSYMSVTSSDCFTARSGSQWSSCNENSSSRNVESSKSEGIFSTVARVVRSALKKLPGASSLQEESRESNISQMSRPLAIASTSKLPTTSINNYRQNSASYLESRINNPTIKRPRDPISPPAISGSALQNEEGSHIAKRPRGWYKIKAREPIARMRKVQVTSPKGISSETQRFQLGSLSAGRQNTIIPLPSRAHQFTQTD